MQTGRLFEILYLLLERGGMTAGELAERFEVSTRTIYRDVDALSGAGIPVYAAKGKGGGIRLLPDFVLNKSLLTEREQNEILFALQSARATGAAEDGEVLPRLRALFQKRGPDWIETDFSHWGGGEEEREKFRVIKKGILERGVLRFTYYSSAGERSERRVEPVRMSFKGGSWYLQAFCLTRMGYRTFKILRMEALALTGERFEPRGEGPPGLEPAPGQYGGRLLRLVLHIAPGAAFRVWDEFGRGQFHRGPDGGFVVAACYPEDNWVYNYLLSFGEDLTVLSPPHVRALLREKAARIAEKYRDQTEYDTRVSGSGRYDEGINEKGSARMDEPKFCQSCGMPMSEEAHFGTEADGGRSADYCCYCYQSGAFRQDCTMDEMIDFCLSCEGGPKFDSREEALRSYRAWFPTLKRWKGATANG